MNTYILVFPPPLNVVNSGGVAWVVPPNLGDTHFKDMWPMMFDGPYDAGSGQRYIFRRWDPR